MEERGKEGGREGREKREGGKEREEGREGVFIYLGENLRGKWRRKCGREGKYEEVKEEEEEEEEEEEGGEEK